MADQHSIFIGYRRDDTGGDAGRIYDRLESKFGEGRVFKDVDSIPRGVKFREYVPSVIGRCQVFLALIGPRWIDMAGADGRRRLDDPEDLVRIEIETALATPGVQLIPVLVAGAPTPDGAKLPPSLRALADINAAQMRRDPDFNVDIGRLIRDLERGMETGRVVVESAPIAPPRSGAAAAWALIENSLDVNDYTDFERLYPGAAELIQAARQRRQLEAWLAADKSNAEILNRFCQTDYFEGLRREAIADLQRAIKRETEAKAAAEEGQRKAIAREIEERRAREAAEAEARRKAEVEARPSRAFSGMVYGQAAFERAWAVAETRRRAEQDSLAKARAPASDPHNPSSWGKVSRNAPCPCGSGRKFKDCHGGK